MKLPFAPLLTLLAVAQFAQAKVLPAGTIRCADPKIADAGLAVYFETTGNATSATVKEITFAGEKEKAQGKCKNLSAPKGSENSVDMMVPELNCRVGQYRIEKISGGIAGVTQATVKMRRGASVVLPCKK
ncbi:MAG: hypothetical protein JST16_12795 [Bdellovibrionales bacterium]|nr:hypothetical protein [Bdellovibrionales bacterium]